jgi:RNA polymerase sigma-70 factor, ECF subfamily
MPPCWQRLWVTDPNRRRIVAGESADGDAPVVRPDPVLQAPGNKNPSGGRSIRSAVEELPRAPGFDPALNETDRWVVSSVVDDIAVNTATPSEPAAADEARRLAFTRFVESRLAEHYRLATVILGDAVEAQDATQDAFERAWLGWPALRDPERLDAWAGRILVNTCRDHIRRRRRQPVTDISDQLAGTLAAPDALGHAADRDEIARAFAILNTDQQIALTLRYFADLSVDQIADRVGAPSGTVKSRLHHAIAAMNGELARAGLARRP